MLLFLLPGCIQNTGYTDNAIYRYGRFEIIYAPTEFGTAEAEAYGYRKERILLRLEEMLDVTYDTIIPTPLYSLLQKTEGNMPVTTLGTKQ